jgi:ribosomal protein S18 acetylase RimI-like enzyme
MEYIRPERAVTFIDLQWDTEFFGITCAKAILHKPLTETEWDNLRHRCCEYQFVTIENCNSEPTNARLIGNNTIAYLADINIQFEKKLNEQNDIPETIQICQAMPRNEKILEMTNFKFSRFLEDPELAKRYGAKIYRQWMIDSFSKPDKFIAVAKQSDNDIIGYILYSYLDNSCIIELIHVANDLIKRGIGTNLIRAVESASFRNGYGMMRVGTQLRNTAAINFYHKVGYKQLGGHQIYHLWNL